MSLTIDIASLREQMSTAVPPLPDAANDYRIVSDVGSVFLARARSGFATLLAPLAAAVSAVGRSGGGFTLTPAQRVVFDHGGRRWEQPAAILECTDERLADTFLVLVADIARRLPPSTAAITWSKVIALVEEWQALLGRRTVLSAEEQLGLWGELWVISRAAEADRLVAAWRGPEGEPVDFFHDGAAIEVKVSRRAHVHHVSQSQLDAPRGEHSVYLLSMWVGAEAVRGVSLSELVDQLLNRLYDPAAFLRQLARAGYSSQDRHEYERRYVLLEPARWFRTTDVPRVRAVDDGISNLRYVVTLDVDRCLDQTQALELWRHFCGTRASDACERGDGI